MPSASIADRVLRVARAHVQRRLPADPRGELAAMDLQRLLVVYGTWRGRFIPQCPRTVHMARELARSLPGSEHEASVRMIRAEFEAGADLNRRLSNDTLIAYTPSAKQQQSGRNGTRHIDTMLAHDGLHHLHLGSGTGAFVSRTEELLFVAVRDEDAYFVGVYPHGSWGKIELLERIVHNWRDANLLHEFAGLVPGSPPPTDEERWAAMQAGTLTLVGIDGAVFMGPGQTTANTPLRASLPHRTTRRVPG